MSLLKNPFVMCLVNFVFVFSHLKIHPTVHALASCLFMPEACNFIKKETLAQVFSCEFCEISKNTFFAEHLWTTASNVSNSC